MKQTFLLFSLFMLTLSTAFALNAPDIVVNPSEFNVTLTTGESTTQNLTITNNGNGQLDASLSIGANRMRSGTPEIIYGQAQDIKDVYTELSSNESFFPSTKNIITERTANYSVLYVNGMSGDTAFREAMGNLSNVSSFESFDAGSATPTVAYMQEYDVVIVASNTYLFSQTDLGDNLADYCDAGGKLIVLAASFYSGGAWTLRGAITGTDYLPLTVTSYYTGTATGNIFISHPITADVSTISTSHYAQTHTQGEGVSLGTYSNGYPVAAYNPNKPIVAINVYPMNDNWGGDFIQMVSNTISWLSSTWISLSETEISIAPGASETIEVTLTSGTLAFGAYTQAIKIASNDPDSQLLNIPVTMTVVEPLVANFTASEPTIYLGESIVFTSSSTGTITDYLWDFGDGNTSTEETPSYTYSQAGLYSVTLTISNAISTDTITKTDYITVNDYPDIAVNPAEFNVTLAAGGTSTEYLTVTNNGQGQLNASLSIGENRERTGSYSVLYIHTLNGEDTTFRTAVSNLSNVSAFTEFNAGSGTPNIAYLQQYDVVIVSTYFAISNSILLGNNLASYCDAGGKLIVLGGSFGASSGQPLSGSVIGTDYMPLAVATSTFTAVTGNNFISHPITQNVSTISTDYYAQTSLQGDGVSLGSYNYTSNPIVAYNPHKAIVAINVFPYGYYWSGDLIQMVSNTIDWLGTANDWLALSATELAIASGASETIELTLTSGNLGFGAYTQAINITSNDPDSPLLSIPVTMIVVEPLVPNFTADEPTIYLGESIQFTNTSTGTIVDYLWEFGDGNTSIEASPSYTYTQSGLYSITLTISNAISSELLTKTDYITVNGVPDIAVNPGEFNVTLGAGGNSTEYLTITNYGEGVLNTSLSIGANRVRSGIPEIIYGQVPSKNITSARSGSYSILYVHTLDGGDLTFRTAMRNLSNVSAFTEFNAELGTPNVAYLQQYDVVIVSTYFTISNSSLLGNNLADYCDAGGKLIVLQGSFCSGSPLPLSGAIMGTQYMPLAIASDSWNGVTGNTFISHPITQNVSTISTDYYATTTTQGDGISLGSYNYTSNPIVAYNPHKAIVAINVFPYDSYWRGDLIQMVSNTINWLGGASDWLALSVTELAIAPGASETIEVTLTSGNLGFGAYTQAIKIASNDPDSPLLNIPVTMTVADMLVADFVAVEPTIYLGESIEFTCSSTGSIDEYLWEFGDGNTSIEETPSYTYTQTGSYSVTLTITNAISNDTITKTDYITVNSVPDIAVDPGEFDVTLRAGDSSTEYLTITNNGEGELEWELVIGNASRAFAKSDGFRRPASQRNISATKNTTNSNDTSIPTIRSERYFNTNKSRSKNVLIFRDNLAWGYNVIVPALENLGATISIASASDMSTVDLSVYDLILFESEQSSSFYNSYVTNKIRFENYLSSGGVIEFHTQANYGANMQFPGEMTFLSDGTNDYNNYINDATHPIVSGLVAPLYGTAASHGAFANLPSGSNTIVINESGFPTMVEYQYGLGTVLATTMPLEFNYNNSYSSGALLPRLLEYSLGVETLNWLTATLSSGTIPAGSSIDVELNINSENLEAGIYTKAINITSNDPNEPSKNIPVTLTLVEELVAEPAIGTLFISEISHSGDANTQYMELYNNSDDVLSLSNIALRMSGASNASFMLNNASYLGDRIILPRNYFIISSYADRATFEATLGTLPEGVNFLQGDPGMLFGVGSGYRWEVVLNIVTKGETIIDDTLELAGGIDNTSYQSSPHVWVYSSSSVGTPGAPHQDQTLPVTLSSFMAVQTAENFAQITWTTESETSLTGYHIYRNEIEEEETAIRVNNSLIVSQNTDNANHYSYIDNEVEMNTTYYYWLQINEFSGSSSFYGPYEIRISQDNDSPEIVIPTKTTLRNIYPNPFNPTTTVGFYMDKAENVKINIYNMRGQLITNLTRANFAEGFHNVVWNGKDTKGNDCASGIYFFRMETKNNVQTLKGILMK